MTARGFQHLTLDERRSLFRMQEAAPDVARVRRRRLAKLARHEKLLAHVVDRLRGG